MKTIVASHNPDLARDFDRDLLRRRDLRLVTARDTSEVLERLRNGADMCLLDRVLPDGDARVALAAIRSERRLAAIPVVLVTAAGAPASDRQEARDAGFADVLELPAAPGVISLLVARLLGMPLREDERFSVRIHVFRAGAPEQSYLGTSVDLSEAGMLLKAPHEVAPGTLLSVRFALPSGDEELQLKARVVRVDERAFAPHKALALAFESLTPADRASLQAYLRALVGGRPFGWQIEPTDGEQLMVTLHGVLRGDTDLSPLKVLRGPVTFSMREFRRVSSDSVHRWIEFIRGLDGVERISLIECPISFVHQANLITNLLERQEVVSFYAPYACDACGLDEEKLIDVQRDLDAGRRREPPPFTCASCGGPLAFDDLVEQYFAFLDR